MSVPSIILVAFIGRLISLILEWTKTVVWSAKYKNQLGFSEIQQQLIRSVMGLCSLNRLKIHL